MMFIFAIPAVLPRSKLDALAPVRWRYEGHVRSAEPQSPIPKNVCGVQKAGRVVLPARSEIAFAALKAVRRVCSALIVWTAALCVRTSLFSPALAIVPDRMVGRRTLCSSASNCDHERWLIYNIISVVGHDDIARLNVLWHFKGNEAQLALRDSWWPDSRR